MKRNLTLRYCTHLSTTEVISASFQVFGATYLLTKGLPAAAMGTLSACSGLLSCATQPLIASMADRAKKSIISQLIMFFSLAAMVCFALMLMPSIPLWGTVVCYYLGSYLIACMAPLHSSVSLHYMDRGYRINYGAARGVGTACYGIASLCLGYLIQWFGLNSMPMTALLLLPILVGIAVSYPKDNQESTSSAPRETSNVSIFTFLTRYRWFCVTLLAYLFLTGFHTMTEVYLISVVERLGGNSSHVGIALFIATISSVFVFVPYNRIREKISDENLLKLGALAYLLKSVLLLLAPNIPILCAIHLLQTVSFAFISPTMVYYARSRISAGDMVKGQAFVTVAGHLGGSLGTFIGGHALDAAGVVGMLISGSVMAAAGVAVMFLSVRHKNEKVGA